MMADVFTDEPPQNSSRERRHPWLSAFFSFGAIMSGLAILLLLWPGTFLDFLWRLNPSAQAGFATLGPWAVALLLIVGVACAFAAIGLARGAAWGRRLGLSILSINALGDLLNAFVRHDYRALIGLPVAGLMIWWLARSRCLNACPTVPA